MFHLFRWLRERLVHATNPRDSTVKPESWEQTAVLTQPQFDSNTGSPRLIMVHSNLKSDRREAREEHAKSSSFRSVTIQCADPKRTAYFTSGTYAPLAPRRPRGEKLNLPRQQVPDSLALNDTPSAAYGTFGARVSHRSEKQE